MTSVKKDHFGISLDNNLYMALLIYSVTTVIRESPERSNVSSE